MSVWEFDAALEGWIAAHAPEDAAMTPEQEDALWARISEKMGRPN